MKYAEVSVNSPVAQRQTYSYSIPSGLDVCVGQAVLVPFGEKVLQGVVMELTAIPAVEETREIIDVISPEPILSQYQISLARWISEYYLSPLFNAVALMLPPAFERKALAFISPVRPDIDTASLENEQNKVMEILLEKGRVELKLIEKALGKKKTGTTISQMVRQGLISRSYELSPVRIKPKNELYIGLAGNGSGELKLTPKQAALYEFLKEQPHPIPWAEARKKTSCSKSVADTLAHRGLVVFQTVEVRREPISYENIIPTSPLNLADDQQNAFNTIKSELLKTKLEDTSPRVFLLRGVTGSGKTEVYLRSLAEAIGQGKKGIVLVPEIALTPQTIERFAARFPRRVGVLHSKLSTGEQFDEWRRIQNGECDVVIGSRSAIFAPQPDLGLIIIDEEHEWTYKQDNSPHYHAREVAVKLAELTGAVVVLGSATPDVESYYKARSGKYRLLELPQRVVPSVGVVLPQVEVVDMREELKAGNRGIFSRSLEQSINRVVSAGEQVILFLNRRGGAYYIQCRRCGFVLRCRRCEVPLAHNIKDDILVCHQCNYKTPVPEVCPNCSSRQLKFLGAGTQKLEQEVKYTFPRARHLRWDSDATTGKTSNEDILRKFRSRNAEILIGTQMVAKGLDIPSVTLVGVVNADTSLNLPDFRAGERTFQLLSQVAGRAGRGLSGGRVIIQTFSPEHYAIQAAARHDYVSFYEQEITYRKQLNNPPFTQLARLSFTHTNDAICQRETEKMKRIITEESNARGISGIGIIGPAPSFIHRLRGRYRWQLIIRGRNLSAFLSPLILPRGWTVDIDPISLIQ
ncbi:MAG: primosomal protein N' [Chloroflexi bacterium RBG_13_51_52]|nr:MAG: primosomal protein N' [Chloroflexi bacterium RBG_13_51_52]